MYQNLAMKSVNVIRTIVGSGILPPTVVSSIVNFGSTKVARTTMATAKPTMRIIG